MKKILPVLIFLLLIACKNEKKSVDYFKMIPEETSFLLHSPNLKDFHTTASSLTFINQNPAIFEELQNSLKFLNYAENTGETLLAFIPAEKKQNFVLISRKLLKFDSTYINTSEKKKIKNREIQKFTLEERNYFTAEKSGAFLLTESQELLENYLETDQEKNNVEFKQISKAADTSKTSIFINHKRLNDKINAWFPNFISKEFGTWSSFDIEFQEEEILLNGISLWKENERIQALFKDVGSSAQEMAEVVPTTATRYSSFGYLDFETFKNNFQSVFDREFNDYQQEILENTTEVSSLQLQNETLVVLNSLNPDNLQPIIERHASTFEEYRSIPIFEFKKPDIFSESLIPLLSSGNLNFVARLDNFLVFSPNTEILKEVISTYRNGNTLISQSFYQEASANFSSRGNMLSVVLTDNLDEQASRPTIDFPDEFSPGPYKMIAMQMVSEQNFSHLHGIFQSGSETRTARNVSPISAIGTEAEISGKPVFFPNHLNGKQDIALQDNENKLYLFSSEGDLYWQKQLNGPVLGEVKAVDLFKNGRYQLAFATPNRLHVFDRNGNEVQPFPLKFRDEITLPLALFDYDNNKNYRFLITQGDELFMYNGKGQIVRGFTFRKAESKLTKAPKHIRMNNKDYIVFPKANGKLAILSRQGKTRVKVTESFNLEDGEWFGNEGDFIAVEDSGNLIKIDQHGRISRETLGLSEEFRLAATGNLRVSLSENKLKIKEREIELDYGIYTKPQIFLINNKYYIALTDTQSEKVYIFDSNAEMLPGFPVFGNSEVSMTSDNNQAPLLLVKADENEVIIYRL